MTVPVPPPDPVLRRLMDLRNALLRLHKTLLESESAWYDREVKRVNSRSELLSLVLHDPEFAWLQELSGFVVQVDVVREGEETPTRAQVDDLVARALALISPDETGAGFARKYFEALQRDPDVVLTHAATRRLLASLT
jgi:hypothetical protein